MHECASCRGKVVDAFRYCPWCAAPQRRKIVEFFRPDPRIDLDRGKALRVSRYLQERHVRFSVWRDGEASAAVSLADDEAERLARFLAPGPEARGERLSSLRALRRRLPSSGSRPQSPAR